MQVDAGGSATHALTDAGRFAVEAGADNKLLAGSFQQARVVFRLVRLRLARMSTDTRIVTSRLKPCTRRPGTRLQVHGANAKTALGFLGARLIVVDEPGAVNDAMWDAIVTSCGKTQTTILCFGTIATSVEPPGGVALSTGSVPGTHVTCLQGDPDTWDK